MDNTITLLFTGDFIPPDNVDHLYSDEMKQTLKEKDFAIVNLETPLTESKEAIKKNGNNFKRSPAAVKHILDGHFDAVTLSNNHISDYSDQGVLDTLKICEEHNIKTVGAGSNLKDAAEPLRLIIRDKKISILNYSEREFNIASDNHAGANPFDLIDVFNQIKAEKEINDFVIVVYHGGLEYQKYPTPEMVRSFKYMVDIGADAVIGHHTHFYSGMIEYKNKPLVFGLGNFYAETAQRNPCDLMFKGLITKININENGKVSSKLIPIFQDVNKKTVGLLEGNKKTQVTTDIKNISAIIEDEKELNDIWRKYYNIETNKTINQIISSSRLEYRIRKRIPWFNKLSQYKSLMILNLMRCDSHRQKCIAILERLLNRSN